MNLKTECDKLWSKVIKARANNKSELSGKCPLSSKGNPLLNAHHLVGKPNYLLRYNLDNGICCTYGEHKFGFHHSGRVDEYREKVKALRGKNTYTKLNKLKNNNDKIFLLDVKEYLEKQLKKYEMKRSCNSF